MRLERRSRVLSELEGLVLGGCAAVPEENGVSFGVLYPA